MRHIIRITYKLTFRPLNDAAGQPLSAVAGRLGPVVIRIVVNDDGSSDNFIDTEFVCEEIHKGSAIIGKQNRKIACMVPMGLIRRIPMASCSHEWFIGISHITYGTHGALPVTLLQSPAYNRATRQSEH